MYSVYQHWDKLKVCVVGKSYPPEFYSYITNPRVRKVMERIAIETEEDYQKLIKLLQSFNVKVVRPELFETIEYYKLKNGRYLPPPMTPRDISAMIGNTFHITYNKDLTSYRNIIKLVKQQGNNLNKLSKVNSAMVTRVGKDLYFGTLNSNDYEYKKLQECQIKHFPNYRTHIIDTEGHMDGTFCPVKPGLIISLYEIQEYEKTFPNWEVIYLPNQSWSKISNFLTLKEKNRGKWWVPGEELNDDFTDFVENWLSNWVGFIEETVFDVNMLVLDKNNVICNNYNKTVFDAFDRHNITPHIINFRHRYFWDGGLHCITSDLDREGNMIDYFPERELNEHLSYMG